MDCVARYLRESPLFEEGPDAGLLPVRQLAQTQDAPISWKTYLFAVGRLLALAITSNTPLDVFFSSCMYKLFLGEKIEAADVARIDPDFYSHRIVTLMRPGGTAVLEDL